MTIQNNYDGEHLKANRHKYEFPRFKLLTPIGWIEFIAAIPKDRYDAFRILEMLNEREAQTQQSTPDLGQTMQAITSSLDEAR